MASSWGDWLFDLAGDEGGGAGEEVAVGRRSGGRL